MIRAAFVLLPKDASIKSPLSLASWIIRFIGADSGLTMAITRSALTMFPNPMFISVMPASLYVLNLLADLLDLGLELDNNVRDIGILAF